MQPVTKIDYKPDFESSAKNKLMWTQRSPPFNTIYAEFRADSMRMKYGTSRAVRNAS